MLGLLALVAGLVVVVAGLAGGVLLAEVRAQDAADAAALAAAHATRTGQDQVAVARRVAAQHGAEFVGCSCRGAAVSVVVRVAVPVRTAQVVGIRHRTAEAVARLVPRSGRRTLSVPRVPCLPGDLRGVRAVGVRPYARRTIDALAEPMPGHDRWDVRDDTGSTDGAG